MALEPVPGPSLAVQRHAMPHKCRTYSLNLRASFIRVMQHIILCLLQNKPFIFIILQASSRKTEKIGKFVIVERAYTGIRRWPAIRFSCGCSGLPGVQRRLELFEGTLQEEPVVLGGRTQSRAKPGEGNKWLIYGWAGVGSLEAS